MQQSKDLISRAERVLGQIGQSATKPIFHYWTKKPSEVAAAIISEFLPVGGIVLDPFLGSGSTLLGFKESGVAGSLIGVDVNQLPLAISELQVDDAIHERLSSAGARIERFVGRHYPYSAIDAASETGLKFASAVLDLGSDLPSIRSIRFGSSRKHVVELISSDRNFAQVASAYLELWTSNCGAYPRDQELVANSRLAAKEGTKVSSLFSPISYRFLLEFSNEFRSDPDVLLVLASCLHHCKFTDKGMQSQFPFWFPKSGAIDRSVTSAISRKALDLIKAVSQDSITGSKLSKVKSFDAAVANQGSCFRLIEKGIQDLDACDVPDEVVDLVITDPPYFDQVAYSEYLSLWEFFVGLRVNLDREIVESNRNQDTRSRNRYLDDMRVAFSNIRRMLKDTGLMFVYFKDSKPQNVGDFVELLQDTGFAYVAQRHLSASRRTYKQNSSPESTVSGDCVMIFSASAKDSPEAVRGVDSQVAQVRDRIRAEASQYLRVNGPASLGELYDNVLIPELIRTGCLNEFKAQKDIFELLHEFKRGDDLRYES